MDERVAKLKTPEECRAFVANARNLGREDLAKEAILHAVALRARAHPANSEVEAECIQALCAYEEALSAKGAKRTAATPIWQMIRKLGAMQAIDKVVSRPDDDERYHALHAMGLEQFAFEQVVQRHPAEFSFEAVEHSRRRIARRKKG